MVIGVALGGLALVALYLFAVEPLINRAADLTELIPAREATLQARQRLIAQRTRLTEEGAEAARIKAIGYFEEVVQLAPGTSLSGFALEVLPPLRETQILDNYRFFCVYD